MKRFKRILFFCNFSVNQRTAIEHAISLARQNEVSLTLLAVVKELPASARMAITVIPPQELLEQVVAEQRVNSVPMCGPDYFFPFEKFLALRNQF